MTKGESLSQCKILLISNDTEARETLFHVLTEQSFNVTVCEDGLDGFGYVISETYHLVIADINLPSINGLELLKQLRNSTHVPIIMYANKNDSFDRIYALELGADDYIVKGTNIREVIARVRALLRRVEQLQIAKLDHKVEVNNILLNLATREVYSHNTPLTFTGKEFDVLHCLMNRAGTVISKSDIAQKALKRGLSYDDRSVDMHISNIRKKLALSSTEIKIKTIRNIGYIFLKGRLA